MRVEQTQWDDNNYKVKLTYAEAKLLSEYSDAYTDDPSCAGPDEEFYIDHVEMVDDDEEDN